MRCYPTTQIINVFGDCLKRLYYSAGCPMSVGRLFQTRNSAAL